MPVIAMMSAGTHNLHCTHSASRPTVLISDMFIIIYRSLQNHWTMVRRRAAPAQWGMGPSSVMQVGRLAGPGFTKLVLADVLCPLKIGPFETGVFR